MVTKVGGLDDNGKPYSHKLTRAQRKSEKLIPLTPAPKTAWEKFKRKAVG